MHGSTQDTSWADKKKKLLMISILVVFSRVLLEGNVPTHGLAKMVTSCKSFAI